MIHHLIPTALGRPTTGAAVLSINHGNLYAALGFICILVWYVLHRHAAHRHPILEAVASVILTAGGVIFAASIGTVGHWVSALNDTSAGWLSSLTHNSSFADSHLGLLTAAAFINLAFVVAGAYHLFERIKASLDKEKGSRNASGGTGGSARTHRLAWFGVGPLSVALPGPVGVTVLTVLTMLSTAISHPLGKLFGLG